MGSKKWQSASDMRTLSLNKCIGTVIFNTLHSITCGTNSYHRWFVQMGVFIYVLPLPLFLTYTGFCEGKWCLVFLISLYKWCKSPPSSPHVLRVIVFPRGCFRVDDLKAAQSLMTTGCMCDHKKMGNAWSSQARRTEFGPDTNWARPISIPWASS